MVTENPTDLKSWNYLNQADILGLDTPSMLKQQATEYYIIYWIDRI